MSFPRNPAGLILLALGCAMVVFAAVVSNESYPQFLLGGNVKELSWGPTLFRVLLALHGGLLVVFGLTRKNLGPKSSEPRTLADAGRESRTTPMVIGVLVALSIIALALRLWNLNSDLWIDEVLTLLDFVRKPVGEILTSFPSQNQHMLFSILAHASTSIFGESSWSLRLPSVLFGIGSIWAFFFLGRRLLSTREALLGCALMTVSYHHIWFSQNARGYMGLLLFTLLATWCWFEALEKNEWRWWLGYASAVVLGMWIHPTMAFVVAAHALIHLVLLAAPKLGGKITPGFSVERNAGFRPFALWMLSVTVTLQLYALALPEFLAVGLHEESKQSEWTNPLWVVTESVKGLSIGFAGILIVICGGALVAFGWVCLFRTNRRAAVLMILPALLAGGMMLLLGHNLWPRFFFFSMGFGLLIVIHGAMQLPKVMSSYLRPLKDVPSLASFAGVGLALLMITASLAMLPKNYALPKQNFSGAKDYVETHVSPGDRIVAVSLAGVVYGDYLKPYWPIVRTGPELESLHQGIGRVWLVYTIPIEVKAFRPDIWRMIERDYEVVQVFPGTLNGGEVFVCRKRIN
jgi:mannosyltransferase